MRPNFRTLALALALALPVATPAAAQTAGFDDISSAGLPGYQGLSWSNFLVLNSPTATTSGYTYAAVSAPNIVFNAGGTPAEIFSASLFTLNSAYLTAAWNDGLSLNVFGYREGSQLFSQALTLNTSGPLLAVFDWEGVDRVRFESSGGVDNPLYAGSGTHFAMDDLTINGAVVAPTVAPEPVSMALLGTGLAGLAAVRRRRRRDEA